MNLPESIPALTLCQPYASAVIYGPKDVENRTWPTKYRGPLVIHAGKSKTWRKMWGDHDKSLWPKYDLASYPYGALLGIIEVIDCVRQEGERRGWAWGPYCWMLDHPGRIIFPNPIPWVGRMGLFRVPASAVIDHDYKDAENSPSGKRGWRCTRCQHYSNAPVKAHFGPCPARMMTAAEVKS